jgi:hypothetical protein
VRGGDLPDALCGIETSSQTVKNKLSRNVIRQVEGADHAENPISSNREPDRRDASPRSANRGDPLNDRRLRFRL